ncbi:hypothetical protein [Blastococcus sp. CT_GayMR16]|uniref:hypothetical protein n=1 Tax=Blastococcus sp. CT_GayMR16 TaxID=2559607 RepID=UPI001072FDBE|nr:hypothetical protein [Blastococcus sp. CT_GayMR16]TFV83137.1 hypothetical protein E4P38_21005 [Blastococcus sp. CT_GayMR16]
MSSSNQEAGFVALVVLYFFALAFTWYEMRRGEKRHQQTRQQQIVALAAQRRRHDRELAAERARITAIERWLTEAFGQDVDEPATDTIPAADPATTPAGEVIDAGHQALIEREFEGQTFRFRAPTTRR